MLTNKSHLHLGGVMFCKFKIHFTRDQDNLYQQWKEKNFSIKFLSQAVSDISEFVFKLKFKDRLRHCESQMNLSVPECPP